MKKIFILIGTLSILTILSYGLFAQQTMQLKKDDPMPEWIIQDIPDYATMKAAFLQYYGSDPEGWPEFIRETVRLDKLLREYNAAKGNADYCYYQSFLMETDNELNPKLNHPNQYRNRHQTRMRNYYTIFAYCYPKVNSKEMIDERQDNPWQQILAGNQNRSYTNEYSITYASASKSEGILPVVLYQFAGDCPTGMLSWCFEEVFPALDHTFRQTDLETKQKIFLSVADHVKKLYKNRDFVKAQVWVSSFYSFMQYYNYSYYAEMPKYLSPYNFKGILSDLLNEEREENIAGFEEIFSHNLYQELSAASFNIPFKANSYGESIVTTGRLRFEKSNYGYINMVVSASNTNGSSFLNAFKNRFTRGVDCSGYMMWPITNSVYKESIGSIALFEGYWERGDKTIEKDREMLFGFKEPAARAKMFGIEFPEPYVTNDFIGFFISEGGQVYIKYPSDFNNFIRQKITDALYTSLEDYCGNRYIVPEIFGMEYAKKVNYRKALKVTSAPRDVKPDGKSEVEISASLYEFIPDEPGSSRPLADKSLSFEIEAFEGVQRGSLSGNTAITDANGKAMIIYTAPETEMLQELSELGRMGSTVKVRSNEYNLDDLAYINFLGEQAKVMAHPSMGIGSNECIIPPDKRFPALVEVFLEGDTKREYANKELKFAITGNKPLGILRGSDGQEGTAINVRVDENGYAKAQYFYHSGEIPEKPVEETIEISTKTSAKPFTALVKIGLNLIFESAENIYEGQEISAGEMIPLKLKLKDAWYPELDLFQIMNYWGSGGDNGDTPLFALLQIEKLGTMPDYLLDQLQIENYPEEAFTERMSVKTFRDENGNIKEFNILWMPEGSVHGYAGMPRIQPKIAGTHYYEARISLADFRGNEIFLRNHPASSAFLTINIGIQASTPQLFINTNPFAPNTKQAQVLRTVLSIKYGSLVSILDAFDAINRGDVDALYRLLFNEVKGALLDQMNLKEGLTKEIAETYSQISLTEQVYYDILNDKTGTLAQIDDAIFNQLVSTFNTQADQLVVLTGEGLQKLYIQRPEKEEGEGMKIGKNVKFKIGGLDKKTEKNLKTLKNAVSKDKDCIEVREGMLFYDKKTCVYSYKKGGLTVYVVPPDAGVTATDYKTIKRY